MSASDAVAAWPRVLNRVWPLPALLAWALAWAAWSLAVRAVDAASAFGLATAVCAALARAVAGGWRRIIVAAGFPVSALAAGLAGDAPAWSWLLPLALLAALYPLRAWRDAPLFPTPAGALDGLAERLPLAPDARVLDAGCGTGEGLRALRSAWPAARVFGIEWSRPLAAWAARRCRFATVRRGDMWSLSWAGFDLVYLFQRPESMARAWAKAQAEMGAGAWLVSLEFAVPGRRADLEWTAAGGRTVRAWRLAAQSRAAGADNPP